MAINPAKLSTSDLNKLLFIEEFTGTDDGAGGKTTDWSMYHEAWAAIEPWKGKERLKADKLEGSTYYRFVIRFAPGVSIDDSMRVRMVDEVGATLLFNIRSVIDVEFKHQWIEILGELGPGT